MQVLLIAQVLICRDEHVVSFLFRDGQQPAICYRGPALLINRVDRMTGELSPQRDGRALIKEDLHVRMVACNVPAS